MGSHYAMHNSSGGIDNPYWPNRILRDDEYMQMWSGAPSVGQRYKCICFW